MEEIDWAGMWKKSLEESSWGQRAGIPEYWDGHVDQFEDVIKRGNRAEMIMSRIEIERDYAVLDIGAGPGTVAIQLAKLVNGVTAVEPSSGMLARLKDNASKEKLTNMRCINKNWEDIEIGKDIDVEGHDIVVASYSVVMKDIKSALLKMNEAAKRNIYIFIGAGRKENKNSFWATFHHGKFSPGPDYIYLYNILYQMGIYANVDIMASDYDKQFSDLESAVQYYTQYFKGWMDMSSSEDKKEQQLRAYLTENLVEEDGVLWQRHKLRTAMVWWRKNRRVNVQI